jgi:tetratricopeptide (TPR) repeat protein
VTDPIHLQNKIENLEPQNEAVEKDPAQEDYEAGKQHQEAGDIVQAAAAYHNALVGFEQSENEKGIANAVCQLGEICLIRENNEQGLAHFQRAYEICDRLNDHFSQVLLKKKMAHAHRCLKQFPEAVRIYMDVLDIYGRHNDPEGAVKVLDELADIYLEMGEKSRAADAYRTAASIHKNFKHTREAQILLDKAQAIEDAEE